MFCCLEPQSDIGPYDNDGLACKVDMFHRGYLPPLVLDELEKTGLFHDFGHNVEGDLPDVLALGCLFQ